jgi:hypothetical protein
MLLTSQITTAPQAAAATVINPWFIGLGVFVVLVALLLGLLMFGAGRDHS